jgi:polyhydroxyalkanoate synthase
VGEVARNLTSEHKSQQPGQAISATQPQASAQAQATSQPFAVVTKAGEIEVDPFKLMRKWGDALNSGMPTFVKFASKQMEAATELRADPLNLRIIAQKIQQELALHPGRMVKESYWRMTKYSQLWMYAAGRMWGLTPEPVAKPRPGDNRFRKDEWTKKLYFDLAKQSYLIWSESIQRLLGDVDCEDPHLKKRIVFYAKFFTDSLAPTNFVWTNPEVLHKIYSTHGESLVDGFMNWIRDVERGGGNLNMTTADETFFEVGKNLAVTPGKVVYQNELMQLIQYSPTTETVAATPVLVTPAWINKYYILDLQPKNSLVKYMVDKGHTVFAISWVNPTKELAGKTFEDYMLLGPVTAIEQIKKATGHDQVNMIGYCLGGTLTATSAAYLAAKGGNAVKSLTLLTTLLDFSEPGDLGVFLDETQVETLEKKMSVRGCLEATEMTAAFNMLRASDLIWATTINNYMLAKPPAVLDFLVWNADSTRMPSEMHKFYLRKMYVENALCKPGGITLKQTPIALQKVDCPVYQISAKDDHIAPWMTTYAGTQIFKGKRRFVLSESGHIAGVVNPPANKKYNHWVNDELVADPEQWFASATYTTGSWWDDWSRWITEVNGSEQVPARQPGQGKLKAIEDAPGSYVKVRASDAEVTTPVSKVV